MGAVGSIDDIGGSLTTVAVAEPYLHIALGLSPSGTFPDEQDVARRCAVGIVPSQSSGEEVHLVVAGLNAVGCHAVGPSPDGGTFEETDVTAPFERASGRLYLNFDVIWMTQDASAGPLIDQITATITLEQ
jgi:hypothetical protein